MSGTTLTNGRYAIGSLTREPWWLLAGDALTSEGFCVIGGYMSPVNDAYKKKSLISAEHRVAMRLLACKSSEIIMTDPCEASQDSYQRTLTVLSRIKTTISGGSLASSDDLMIMLVCGSDLLESLSEVKFLLHHIGLKLPLISVV
ncbi:hypothetical protein RND71_019400 [Anisodus tanguticus]|uniref:Cytidyltransferase-like domain-containing protein n=1 Tax=Anisodus tanguticus TaxID=243964 RepID=A0AAE1RYY0_9SOLA|nr:hypothetical protein RND71_019400 [Anisodus tanguticus]